MKKFLFLIALAVSQILQAQSLNFKELGIDSSKYMAKLDSAIKVTPEFGYTVMDSAALMMKLLSPEDMSKLVDVLKEEFEKYDPYEHISTHLEGGWEVAGNTDDEYYLIKSHRGDKYWIKKLTKGISNEYYKSSLLLLKIDCTEGMWGIVQGTEYDAKGVVTNSIPAMEDFLVNMSYAAPDTVGEAFVESACK